MNYLEINKKQLINLNYSLKRELLRTNRAGSYSSTTSTFCNTRKYHGMLVTPLEYLDGEKHVLLASVDDTIIQHEKEFHIGSRKYPEEYHPLGHKYLQKFTINPIPTHIYRVGGVILKKETIFTEKEELILIKYTLLDAHSPTKIKLQPYLAFRQIHKLSKANLDINTKFDPIPNGIKVKLYNGYPYLHMQTSKKSEYTHAPDWYYNIEYTEEKKRGYEYLEDLMAIGFFEFSIEKGKSVIFAAGTKEIDHKKLHTIFNSEIKKRTPRTNFQRNLENAAQQFFIQKNNNLYINAGFHWFGVWARDTFIALPGLTLSRNDTNSAKKILTTMSKELRNGLFPNCGLGLIADVNSVDAPLWYIWAIQKYVEKTETYAGIWKNYGKQMLQIIKAYINGTNEGIKMHDNGLIYSGINGKALTWMDAFVNGKAVTPRIGYNVEINALWYNALKFVIEAAKKARKKKTIEQYIKIPETTKKSFIKIFWNNEKQYLADYYNQHEKQNWDVRPNQIIATSLPYTMLNEDQIQQILKITEKELLTPRGLRSLSPKHKNYKGIYEGNQQQRDLAFHQGTAFPWLLGHFAEGYLKIYGKNKIKFIEKIYQNFEQEMNIAGIGTISEIYDGDPPFEPKGAISQAKSVAEIIRIKTLIEKYK